MKIVRLHPPYYGFIADRFSQALVNACHAVPGMRFDKWVESPNRLGKDGEPGVGYQNVWWGYPDACEAVYDKLTAKRLKIDLGDLPLKHKRDWGTPIVPLATKSLLPHQIEGAKFLINRGTSGALLADQMGVMKTAQGVTAIRALKSKAVVVCPNSVRGVWGDELQKWWPASEPIFLSGTKPEPIPNDALGPVILHYEILYAWLDILIAWAARLVLFDEIHALQSEESRRSKAARTFAKTCEIRIGLSGTPMTNRPRDLWNIIDILSPGRVGKSFFDFGKNYCGGHKVEIPEIGKTVWNFDGRSNEEELHQRMGWFMLRRTVDEVKQHLPDKTRQVVWLDAPVGRKSNGIHLSKASKRELQACLSATSDLKIPHALELIYGHVETSNAKVVAFCWRQAIAEWVAENCRAKSIECDLIHGSIPVKEREKRLDRFASYESGVLAATIDVAGQGVNKLVVANVAVFCELVYEPWKLAQAEKRLHRPGQKRNVLLQYVAMRGSVDELVLSVILDKIDGERAIVGQAPSDTLREDLAGSSEDAILKEIFRGVGETG